MSYRKIDKPTQEQLSRFADRKAASAYFGVNERTIARWQESYGLYEPRENYGRGKLKEKAELIRKAYESGLPVKEIAAAHEVTPSAIGRVIHNITYAVPKYTLEGTALVSVTYNPNR